VTTVAANSGNTNSGSKVSITQLEPDTKDGKDNCRSSTKCGTQIPKMEQKLEIVDPLQARF